MNEIHVQKYFTLSAELLEWSKQISRYNFPPPLTEKMPLILCKLPGIIRCVNKFAAIFSSELETEYKVKNGFV